MSHTLENTATLEENVVAAQSYMQSKAAATMRELYAKLNMDKDFVERAFIQKACRGLDSARISSIQARLRELELPVRSAFIVEAWEQVSARERGEFIEGEEYSMYDITAEKTMTVREVADILGVTDEAVKWHIRKLYPDLMRNGITTLLNQEQITEIKQNMIPTSRLVGTITDMEAAEMLLRSAEHFKTRFEQERSLREAAEKRLSIAEPKAEYHDRLVDARLTTNFRDTAKEIGVPEHQFIETLIRKGYIYRDAHGNLKPYHNRMDYFVVKDWENGGKAGTQTRITVAGKRHFLSLFKRIDADKPLFS
jgi:phage antirepressor YoqD-like protein